MKDLVKQVGEVITIYAAVDGFGDVEAIAAVATSGPEIPGWLDGDRFVDAVQSAKSVDGAGVAYFQRPDGSSWSFPLVDPPRTDVVSTGPLPDLVPLLEVMHRTVDHVLISTVEPDIGEFDQPTELSVIHVPGDDLSDAVVARAASGDPSAIAEALALHIPDSCELVVTALPDSVATAVNDRLADMIPPTTPIAPVDRAAEDLADEAVRAVADFTARELVETVRMFRFLDAHSQVAQGLQGVLDALGQQKVTKLLLSADDRGDDGVVYVEPDGTGVSNQNQSGWIAVRPLDGLIRSALLNGIPVQIIPTHLADGPDEGVGALLSN